MINPLKGNQGLILNIAPVRFSNTEIEIGRIPFKDAETYEKLQQDKLKTHAFRYDTRKNEITNIAIAPRVEPVGSKQIVNINEHLFLTARAIQQAILVWLSPAVPIIKWDDKQLSFWGTTEDTKLLSKVLQEFSLPIYEGLEVSVRYQIDCRMFFDKARKPFLGIVIDIGTSLRLDIPVTRLISAGYPLEGKYVVQRGQVENEYLESVCNDEITKPSDEA